MTDLATFNPATAEELFRALVREGGEALGRPLDNVQAVAGHLHQLAEDSLKTARALVEGRIDEQTAREAFAARKRLLLQIGEFVELQALQAAQRAADAIFRVIGAAIRNRTGIDLLGG